MKNSVQRKRTVARSPAKNCSLLILFLNTGQLHATFSRQININYQNLFIISRQ
jgi:hypothetical protein